MAQPQKPEPEQPWRKIPVEALDQLIALNEAPLKVWLYYRARCGQEGKAWGKASAIGKACGGMAVSTVKNARHWLVKNNWLKPNGYASCGLPMYKPVLPKVQTYSGKYEGTSDSTGGSTGKYGGSTSESTQNNKPLNKLPEQANAQQQQKSLLSLCDVASLETQTQPQEQPQPQSEAQPELIAGYTKETILSHYQVLLDSGQAWVCGLGKDGIKRMRKGWVEHLMSLEPVKGKRGRPEHKVEHNNCCECGSPDRVPPYPRCQACLDKFAALYPKTPAPAWCVAPPDPEMERLCAKCNKVPPVKSGPLCGPCRKAEQEKAAAERRRHREELAAQPSLKDLMNRASQ